MSEVNIHPAAKPIDALLTDCDISRTRRSGPGGQHRNKVETAVVITHRPTNVQAEAGERRSQEENRKIAIFRLRLKLALHVRSTSDDDAPQPSDLWSSRCVSGRISVSPSHDDFPTLLAEALDVLAAYDMDVKEAAERLQCSTSQLVKLLQMEPQALAQVNRRREELGLRPLKPR